MITQTLHGTAIYAYIGVVWGVNVGIYAIHGVSGSWIGTSGPISADHRMIGPDVNMPGVLVPREVDLWDRLR